MHMYLGQRNNAYFFKSARFRDTNVQRIQYSNSYTFGCLQKFSTSIVYLVLIGRNLTELNLKHASSERSNSFLK